MFHSYMYVDRNGANIIGQVNVELSTTFARYLGLGMRY